MKKCDYCNSEIVIRSVLGKKEEVLKHEKDCEYIKKMVSGELKND